MLRAMKARKPGVPRTQGQAVLTLAAKKTLLRARDIGERGLPTVLLTRLVAAGKLERVARGLYALPKQPLSEHRSLAEVAVRVPRGVVWLLSALRVHDIGSQAPQEVWLAIPHRMLSPRLEQPRMRIVRMSGAAMDEGIERFAADGVGVPVFNGGCKEFCVCEPYDNLLERRVVWLQKSDSRKSC